MQQKKNSKKRSIEWLITFKEWYELWGDHLWGRGRTSGTFVMCRYGDDGPYKVGNVYLATVGHNHSAWRSWMATGSKFEKAGVLPVGIIAIT
jgi:hypothetical protein